MDATDQPTDMPPQYDPRAAEARWSALWLERRLFHSEPNPAREPYCIVLPPPNVTGALHAGHAFQQSLQDFVIRRARMQGLETLWLPGTDHAGIATQVVVERELAKEGIDRREMGREAFLERVWQWKEQYGGRIVEQMQALGNSCDWDRLRFTMDEGLSQAVRVAFVRMYDDGLIYRGERIINWCPQRPARRCRDSEVEHEDVDGELVTFRYELVRRQRARRRRDHAGRDHARRHGRRGAPGRRAVRGAGRPRPCGTRSTGATSRSWPTRPSTRRSAPAR